MGTMGKRIRGAVIVAGSSALLAGCGGGSYEDSRELYEELRADFHCEAVDSDAFQSFLEGELANGFPAFDVVEGECMVGDDDSISVSAVIPHDVKGDEFLSTLTEVDDTEGYALQSGKWVVLVDEQEPEVKEWLNSVKDELGGEVVAFTGGGDEY
ncbi:hypothetical protein [Brachybacterium sp. FME24]|uniref:hypothetical protein n=1 Tax=Brachybacterium sp. FME24 TaxID=2742605 RepID=UPI001867152D|nr:hypothetical protein [Brachybacterium sp. FME24]